MRPFPIEKQENALQVNPPHFYQQVLPKFDLKSFKQELMTEIRAAFEQVVAGQMAEVKERYDQLLEKMPDFPTDDDAREKDFKKLYCEEESNFNWKKKRFSFGQQSRKVNVSKKSVGFAKRKI